MTLHHAIRKALFEASFVWLVVSCLLAGILIGRMTDQHPLFATISGPCGPVSSLDEI